MGYLTPILKLKKVCWGSGSVLTKTIEQAANFTLPPWNSKLSPICARVNSKATCTKAQICPGEKIQFLDMGKRSCFPCYRKSKQIFI